MRGAISRAKSSSASCLSSLGDGRIRRDERTLKKTGWKPMLRYAAAAWRYKRDAACQSSISILLVVAWGTGEFAETNARSRDRLEAYATLCCCRVAA